MRKPDTHQTSQIAAERFAQAEKLRSEQRKESSQRAIENYKEAARLWLQAGQLREAAGALRNVGEIYQTLGDTQSALDHYQKSLSFSRRTRNALEESKVLNDLGYLYFVSGDNPESLTNCLRARKLAKAIGNREVEAQAISNIGETYYGSGDLPKALKYQKEALDLWRKLENPRGQARTYVALGYAYMNLSEPRKALESYQQALNLSRGANDLRDQALALIAIGNLQAKLGEKQGALDSCSSARLLVEQIGDRTSLANVLGLMGYIYFGLGDKEKALDCTLQSLKLFQLNGQKWGTAETKMDLARTHHSLGNEQEALDYYREALAGFKSLSMPRLEAQTLRDLGQVYSSIGDKKGALTSYQQALKLTRMGQDQRQEAYTLNYIGHLYEISGDAAQALSSYRQGLSLSQVAADPAVESLTLFNLAHIERDRGNLNEARGQIEAAIKIAESLRTKVFSQDLRASYFATVRQHYELYIDILMRLHKEHPGESYDAQAFAISEKAHARSFLELLQEARADIRKGVDPALLERERSLEETLNARAERHVQLLAKKDKEEADKIAKEIDKLTTEYTDVRDQIKATSPHYAALTLPQPLTLKEVQQQILDDDSLLLEYTLGDERSYVWAVTRTGVSSHELPPRAQIEASVQRLYKLVTSYQPLPGEPLAQRRQRETKAEEAIPSETASLSKLLLGPLVEKLGNKRLLVVADGALQYIPFQALTIPETPGSEYWNQLLLSRHEIVNELSASTLALLLKETAGRQRAVDSVAVLADPVFEADDPRVNHADGEVPAQSAETLEIRKVLRDMGISPDGVQIPRLIASREEADGIMSAAPWGTGLKSVGFNASRSKVLGSDLARYRIVHFATHGLVNTEHPELSGIVLSLFDEQGRSQDGFLRLHDIYNMHLPVDLVVLSACSTGLGKDVKGEGMIGLTRGFMYAGAAGVVASLWKVDDDATAELMKNFYQGIFTKGLSPSAALRDAQLAMSRQKRWHAPYFWAGFVIQGQYNQKEDMGRRSLLTGKQVVVSAVLASTLLLASFFVFRRRRGKIN